jgi:hypothetical protein
VKINQASPDKLLPVLLLVFLSAMILTGFLSTGIEGTIKGFLQIQVLDARLISDYTGHSSGIGGSLLSAALVGIVGLIMVRLSGIPHSGPTYAAVLTLTGFGFFGKTPLNVLPIILGVYISAKFIGKNFKDYLIIALFGTALGPLWQTIGTVAFGATVPGFVMASIGGLVTGFFLPPLAVAMLHLHQGYNLYNMGLTCGFFGLFAANFIRLFHPESIVSQTVYAEILPAELQKVAWNLNPDIALVLLVPVLSLILIVLGLILGGKSTFKDFIEIQKEPGRLPSDFVDLGSLAGMLLNSGLVGLIGSIYVYLVGAPYNGPVIGGLLTIIGFGAFGTHLRNSWPVVAGVILATIVGGFFNPQITLFAPGPILAAIFVTTLGPLAGQFGVHVGLMAGFVHFFMVMQTGAWHGGMNLYNNGFAGGLTAALIIAVIQWYKTNKEEF